MSKYILVILIFNVFKCYPGDAFVFMGFICVFQFARLSASIPDVANTTY